ncbi:MAG: hypothetical protein JWP86_1241 [Phenylobacterium sp.]|nr:hypothetical protein [Phenylobacterium sp.]
MTQPAQADTLRTGEVATRVLTAGVADGLGRVGDPTLLAAGHVNLISLDAIAETFGSRWSFQAIRVEKFAHRLLAHELQGEETFLQVSPTDVLISLPSHEREAAQVVCLRYLRQVLHHFLGSSARAPDGVYEVVSVSGDRVEARPVDPAELLAREQEAEIEREREEALARAIEPFIASHGRRIRVACELEPLLNLGTGACIGLRLAQRVSSGPEEVQLSSDAVAAFAGIDRQRVDWSTVIHGLAQHRERGQQTPTLIVSMSYASLSSQRGRTEMVGLLQQARQHAALGVICEVSGIEGAPHAQLEEAVAIIRPLSLFVVGKIDSPSQLVWSHLRGAGLRGLAFDCPPFEGDAVFLGWAKATAAKARTVASSVLFYGAPSVGFAPQLAEAGVTHATLAA